MTENDKADLVERTVMTDAEAVEHAIAGEYQCYACDRWRPAEQLFMPDGMKPGYRLCKRIGEQDECDEIWISLTPDERHRRAKQAFFVECRAS